MYIKEFLKTITSDPKALELLKSGKEPANVDEAIARYSEIAKELGLDVKQDELAAFLHMREKVQKKLTEEAGAAVKEALDENGLENVAGGADGEGEPAGNCASTMIIGEWCWLSDYCSVVINTYHSEKDDEVLNDVFENSLRYLCELDDRGEWDDIVDIKCEKVTAS